MPRTGQEKPAHQELVEILNPWLIAVGAVLEPRSHLQSKPRYQVMTLAGRLEIASIEYSIGAYSKKGQNCSHICTKFEWSDEAKAFYGGTYGELNPAGKWNHMTLGPFDAEYAAASFCEALARSLPFFQFREETLNWSHTVRDPLLQIRVDVLYLQLKQLRLWEQLNRLERKRSATAIAQRQELEAQRSLCLDALNRWESERPPFHHGHFAQRVRSFSQPFLAQCRTYLDKYQYQTNG